MSLPGPGFSLGGVNTTNSLDFRSLGPLFAGLVLDRLEVFCVSNATVLGAFSAVLTSSPDSNAAAFDSGASLITTRVASVRGKAAFAFLTGGAEVMRFAVPLGLRITVGSKFVLLGLSSVTAVTVLEWNVSLFTVLPEGPG